MKDFLWRQPESFEELFALRSEYGDDARLIAGGSALLLMLKQGPVTPECLLSLRGLPMTGVRLEADGRLRIGATATHATVELDPLVRHHAPTLAETLSRVASLRIRHTATLGGNLAHADPAQDPPATLLALDASVLLRSPNGVREIPIEELFADYYETTMADDEVLEAIVVPPAPPRSGTAFSKFAPRTLDDYGTVVVSARLTLAEDGETCADVRLAAAGAGPTPLRLREAEAVLHGRRQDDAALDEAAAAAEAVADPLDDLRGSAAYKRAMLAEFTRRTLVTAWERARISGTG